MKITKSSLCFTNNNRQQRDVFHGAVELLITVRESPSRTILWKPRSAANFRACNVEVASVVVGSRIFELSCEPAANTYPSESLIKKPELELRGTLIDEWRLLRRSLSQSLTKIRFVLGLFRDCVLCEWELLIVNK
ncbi:hypothetical protein V6N13_143156 [Hibiscus sabdariffa]|uniref:Uncharacterized protein n=1 Tax=Hibiscus sabdariffa TaxID=183260 RepID=A0ABR2FGE7_9ROSI